MAGEMKMTNTYSEDAPYNEKLLEEIRCLRCVNERILRCMDESLFVDYQMEKFGKMNK
jgi:cytochrome c-type biogenesis protein CcmH/NrfF